jgi:hypothetical protein
MAEELDPEYFSWLRNSKRKINDQYGINVSQNQYQQDTLRNAYARQQGDMASQYGRARVRLPGQYAARGMLNSGKYQRALTDLATDRTRSLADAAGSYQDQLGAYTMARGQLEQVRAGGLADLEDAGAARRAAIASALRLAGI